MYNPDQYDLCDSCIYGGNNVCREAERGETGTTVEHDFIGNVIQCDSYTEEDDER